MIAVGFLPSSQEGHPEIPVSIIESTTFLEEMAVLQHQVGTGPCGFVSKTIRVYEEITLKIKGKIMGNYLHNRSF